MEDRSQTPSNKDSMECVCWGRKEENKLFLTRTHICEQLLGGKHSHGGACAGLLVNRILQPIKAMCCWSWPTTPYLSGSMALLLQAMMHPSGFMAIVSPSLMLPRLHPSGLSCVCTEAPACVNALVVCLESAWKVRKVSPAWFILKAFNSYNFLHLSHASLSFINYTSLIVFLYAWGVAKKKATEALPMEAKSIEKFPHEIPQFRKRLWSHPGRCWECWGIESLPIILPSNILSSGWFSPSDHATRKMLKEGGGWEGCISYFVSEATP